LIIKHGLYVDLEKYKIDGRSALGQAIARAKEALGSIFPDGPNAAAQLLIQRMVYKIMRLEVFENWDFTTGEAGEAPIRNYVFLSNSLRKDLQLLCSMAKEQEVSKDDPDLKEYLETVKKAAKAEVVKVDKK